MAAKFVLRKHGAGSYLILFQTHSGQVLLTSEVETYKDIALRRISMLRSLAHNEKNYELRTEADGCSYFVIKDGRGEVLGLSDIFPDRESLQRVMNLVKGNARGARLEDLTLELAHKRARPVRMW